MKHEWLEKLKSLYEAFCHKSSEVDIITYQEALRNVETTLQFFRMIDLALRNEELRRESERINQRQKLKNRKARVLELYNRLLLHKKCYAEAHNSLLKAYASLVSLQSDLLKNNCIIVQAQKILQTKKTT